MSRPWEPLLAQASPRFTPIETRADDPALLIYTSGTTGPPKGALIAAAGAPREPPRLRAFARSVPQAGDLFWSPADWAWTGGLMDALLPSLTTLLRCSATAVASIPKRRSG